MILYMELPPPHPSNDMWKRKKKIEKNVNCLDPDDLIADFKNNIIDNIFTNYCYSQFLLVLI